MIEQKLYKIFKINFFSFTWYTPSIYQRYEYIKSRFV